MIMCYILLALILLFGSAAQALTAHKLQVRPVQSRSDMIDLGDLRYQEWVMQEDPEARPSQMAFRMATAEVQQERMAENKAVAFLARDNSVVVGSAELSAIELQGCDNNNEVESSSKCRYLYVTDVVTASAHRRKGVAATLMEAVEQHALELHDRYKQSTVLLLHVKPDNEAALGFYKALGYEVIVSAIKSLEGLDVDRLAVNAGVKEQLLLSKTLKEGGTPASKKATKKNKSKASKRGGGGKGFGS